MSYNIRLLIDCPDHRGLVASVSSFIALHGGNILSADQELFQNNLINFVYYC